jgi:hypothetical protein
MVGSLIVLVALLGVVLAAAGRDTSSAMKAAAFPAFKNVTTKMCGYEDTCNAGGLDGVCVSVGSGCCDGGTVTSGLCPGL